MVEVDLFTLIVLGSTGFMLLGAVAFAFGRILDTHFRAKVFRIITKKDYGILGIASQDRKNIRKVVVNFEHSVIKLGTDVWVIQSGRIYRQEKPETGFSFQNSKGELSIDTFRYEEGIPILYVDITNLKPLNFYPQETGKVPPEELGSFLSSWIANQIAKGMNVINEYRTFLIVIIVLNIILLCLLAYMLMGIGDIKTALKAGAPVAAQIAQNGSMVITGSG
jgi:hypothetical protein